MYEHTGNVAKPRAWLRPLSWVARALSELRPDVRRGALPKGTGALRGDHASPSAAALQFIEHLSPAREFRLIEELLGTLGQQISNNAFYRRLLVEIDTITGSQGSVLYRTAGKDRVRKTLAASLEQPDRSLDELLELACPLETLAADPGRQTRTGWIDVGEPGSAHDENGTEHCRLLLQMPGDCHIGRREIELLQQIATSINGIMRNLRRAKLDQQFMHDRERALIARELHDSLAQSLSFLKIQLARIETGFHKAADLEQGLAGQLRAPLQELRRGVDLSYRQLRELINTFRLTLNGKGLAEALQGSLEEFENLCDMAFTLDNRLSGVELSIEEQTHILLVVREALSNAVRHSRGTRVEASLWEDADGTVCIRVCDDGIGIMDTLTDSSHHGLQIMRQRMQELHGELNTGKGPLDGTCIEARFRPCNREQTGEPA